MERKEIGRFHATTFDGQVYEFIVYNDKKMDCPKILAEGINRLLIKPRFKIYARDKDFIEPTPVGRIDGLIKDFDIENELFKYLKEENMISYSTDMAYLYNFKDKDGYDKIHKGRAFKRVMKKGPILTDWKKGEYN